MAKNPWQAAFNTVKRNVADVRQELRRRDAGDSDYKSGFDDALRGVADAIKLATPKVKRTYHRKVKVKEPDARATVADALNELAPV